MIPIKYIGQRPSYREGAYGSGITFEKGQTVLVPVELASKLLRHPDVYVRGEEEVADSVAEAPTAAPDEPEDTDLFQTLDAMDKDALEAFARTHFSMELDKRKTLPKLREEVRVKIDQFGIG